MHPFPVCMDKHKKQWAPQRLRTARVIADRIGVTAETIRVWVRRGIIPTYRAGQKTLRFDLEEVLSALRSNRSAEEDQDV